MSIYTIHHRKPVILIDDVLKEVMTHVSSMQDKLSFASTKWSLHESGLCDAVRSITFHNEDELVQFYDFILQDNLHRAAYIEELNLDLSLRTCEDSQKTTTNTHSSAVDYVLASLLFHATSLKKLLITWPEDCNELCQLLHSSGAFAGLRLLHTLSFSAISFPVLKLMSTMSLKVCRLEIIVCATSPAEPIFLRDILLAMAPFRETLETTELTFNDAKPDPGILDAGHVFPSVRTLKCFEYDGPLRALRHAFPNVRRVALSPGGTTIPDISAFWPSLDFYGCPQPLPVRHHIHEVCLEDLSHDAAAALKDIAPAVLHVSMPFEKIEVCRHVVDSLTNCRFILLSTDLEGCGLEDLSRFAPLGHIPKLVCVQLTLHTGTQHPPYSPPDQEFSRTIAECLASYIPSLRYVSIENTMWRAEEDRIVSTIAYLSNWRVLPLSAGPQCRCQVVPTSQEEFDVVRAQMQAPSCDFKHFE